MILGIFAIQLSKFQMTNDLVEILYDQYYNIDNSKEHNNEKPKLSFFKAFHIYSNGYFLK